MPKLNDQAALCWVAGTDPTGGMEYVTDKAIAENDPSKQRDLAKALLQERANLKDFVCQVRTHLVRKSTVHRRIVATSDEINK